VKRPIGQEDRPAIAAALIGIRFSRGTAKRSVGPARTARLCGIRVCRTERGNTSTEMAQPFRGLSIPDLPSRKPRTAMNLESDEIITEVDFVAWWRVEKHYGDALIMKADRRTP
jgi:hypothetical protein